MGWCGRSSLLNQFFDLGWATGSTTCRRVAERESRGRVFVCRPSIEREKSVTTGGFVEESH